MSADVVTLVGEGGAEWQFELPLSEVYADQVKNHALKPADPKSAAAVAHLLVDPEAAAAADDTPPLADGEKSIDEMSGNELDALAAKLEVDGWKSSAKVGDKKETLKAFIATKATAEVEDDDVADLDDDELNAKAAELGVDLDPNADRDTVLAAVRAHLAAE